MKSLILLLLRASTGIYLALWGVMKVVATEKATGISQKYYAGLLDGQLLNYSCVRFVSNSHIRCACSLVSGGVVANSCLYY